MPGTNRRVEGKADPDCVPAVTDSANLPQAPDRALRVIAVCSSGAAREPVRPKTRSVARRGPGDSCRDHLGTGGLRAGRHPRAYRRAAAADRVALEAFRNLLAR